MRMKLQRLISYLLLGFAVFMRLLTYYRNRSLFYDEINLARNYAEKDYIQLLGHLDYNQHAPPFFNWMVKFSTSIFGMNEYALRLFPFAAGVTSIFLFYKIAKKFLSDFSLWFALILFGFSSYLLEYGTEVKQYSTDVFWTCLLIYAALKIPFNNFKSGVFWAIGGAITIWFSMPSVFILAGIGFHFAFRIYTKNSSSFFSNIKGLVAIIGLWLVSFALLYQVNLQHSLGSNQLESFHNQFFLKFGNLTQTGNVLIGVIRSIVGHTTVPIVFAISCLFVGCFRLFQKDKMYLILFTTPPLFCFFASFLQQYSLIVRLIVFMFPIFILLMSIGLSTLYEQVNTLPNIANNVLFVLLIALSISCLTERSALQYIYQPLVKEDARSVLERLAQEDLSNTTLIVTDCGKPGFLFYTQHCKSQIDIKAKRIIIQEEYQPIEEAFESISDTSIWVFDSHTFGEKGELLERQIKKKGNVRQRIESKNAQAIRF
ncbi:MAG: 4-amino-4-deoxy-L-arabinose transferase-like glycosyltransferase [Saprospiraceae bacterium]|jgi:4-amino-4-deoxy-L-arabinose transferase-like glycosyltransferase